ncbi:MAG TPA: PAS domain-containing protein, partial [candidate division Zixibacteria bacterium]|nr:PAS domain-containing protein [candidate division Zixibacteria bacterium]
MTLIEEERIFRDLLRGCDGFTGSIFRFILRLIHVHVLEVEDVLFHLNSAVMMPARPAGLTSADGTEDDVSDSDDARVQQQIGRPMGPEGVPIETVRDWVHPDDLDDLKAAFEKAVHTGLPVDSQTRYSHSDGRWRCILTRRVVQRGADGQPVSMIGVGLDISEQQARTEEALQLARRLDAAAEAARVGLWSVALDGSSAQWNSRMYTLLGHDPAKGALRLGDSLRHYAHPADRDRVAAQVLAWFHGPVGTPLLVESRIVRPDGAIRWLEIRGAQEIDS